jgi:hypothetical protein
MTRQGRITGGGGRKTTSAAAQSSLRVGRSTPDGAPVAADDMDAARINARRYLERTGNADVLPALGLAPDPAAEERNRAKAAAPHDAVARMRRFGTCVLCGNTPPARGGPCRRTRACRKAAEEESK